MLVTGAAGRIGTVAARRAARARLGGALPRRRPGARRPAGRGAARRRRHRPRRDGRRRAGRRRRRAPGRHRRASRPGRRSATRNIEGTYAALEAARRAGVQRVVLASSNHATGFTPRPAEGLLREDDAPPRPDTVLRRREGGHGGARLAVRRPVRHGRRLPADRQRVPRADDGRGCWPPGSPPPTPSPWSTPR